MRAEVVERWVPAPKPFRRDLFHIIDIIALDPERGILGIQSCGADFAGHMRKLQEHGAEVEDWRLAGGKLELWSWRPLKIKRGGKLTKHEVRIVEIT